jgi:hypothetical protein
MECVLVMYHLDQTTNPKCLPKEVSMRLVELLVYFCLMLLCMPIFKAAKMLFEYLAHKVESINSIFDYPGRSAKSANLILTALIFLAIIIPNAAAADCPVVTISTPDAYLNCSGTDPILNSTTNGTGPFTYQWYNNSAIISGATSFNFTASDPGTYNLSVTNTSSPACTNSSNYLVIHPKSFLVSISTTDAQLNCTGTYPVLKSTVTGSGPFSYKWYNNSVIIPSATSANFVARYPGTYNLSVTNTSSLCTNSSPSLIIHSKVYPLVTISTQDAHLNCTGTYPVLKSTVSDGIGPFGYQWYNNSAAISGAINNNFTARHPGNYKLRVTNTSSTCQNNSSELVIYPTVTHQVAISTQDQFLNCSGACPILKSTITGGPGPYAYQWYNNSNIISGATSTNFIACFPGNYSLKVTNNTSSCYNTSDLLTIYPHESFRVTISTPNTYLNCTGPCPILNSTTVGGPGPYAYQWYNNSNIISGATGASLTACFPGSYSLRVTNNTSLCTNSSNLLVIHPKSFTVTITTPNAYLNCTGPCPILKSTLTGTGPFSYQWYNNSNIISGATNANFTACHSGNYSLTATNMSSGCINSSSLLTIYSIIYSQVNISTPDTQLNCTGPCPILDSTIIGGIGPFAYRWYNGSSAISGAVASNFTACHSGNYSLRATNTSSGCINSSNLLVIHAKAYPSVSISTPNDLLNCTGICPRLTSNVTGGIGPFAYQWYNNSTAIPGATGFNFTACFPGNYSLIVANTTICCTNSSNLLPIYSAVNPLVRISTPDALLNCTGTCPVLNSTITDGSGPFSYQWYNDSTIIPGAVGTNFTACYPGNYSLRATNTSSQCFNNSNTMTIYAKAYPLVRISTPDALLNCTGPCPILKSIIMSGSGPFSYRWYNDSTIIPGAVGANFTTCFPGNYSLTVTNTTSGCVNSSSRLAIRPKVYPLVIISTPNIYLNCTGPCPILKSMVDGPGPYTYQWYNNSEIIPGAALSSFTACSPGTYNLDVTNTASGCINRSNDLVIVEKACPGMALEVGDNLGGHFIGEGETIIYTYRVTNLGFANLKNVTVRDNRSSTIIGPISPGVSEPSPGATITASGELKPGETWIFEGRYTVKFSDLAGDIVNAVQAYAEDPAGDTVASSSVNHAVYSRPPLDQPTQFEQYCEAKKVSGEGTITSGTSIMDRKLALEYNNAMSGKGDMEIDQEQAYSQNSDKLKRNVTGVNGVNQTNLNLFEQSSMTYSGDDPLVGEKQLNSRGLFGGMGADVRETFAVNQMEKEQTTFFSTIPEETKKEKGSDDLMGRLKAADRNTSRVSDLMGNNSAYLLGMKTTNAFNGTWGTESNWHKIFYKDINSRQAFSGTFEADKIIKFHESPVPEKSRAPCEGIDC